MSTPAIQERAQKIYRQEETNLAAVKIGYSDLRTTVHSAFDSLAFQAYSSLRQLIIDYSLNLYQLKQVMSITVGDKSGIIKTCIRRINWIFREIYQSDGIAVEILPGGVDNSKYRLSIRKEKILKEVSIEKELAFEGIKEIVEGEILGGVCCRAFQNNLHDHVYELLSFFDSGKPYQYLKSLSCLSAMAKLPRLFALSLVDSKNYCRWRKFYTWNFLLEKKFQRQDLHKGEDCFQYIYGRQVSSLDNKFLTHSLAKSNETAEDTKELFESLLDLYATERSKRIDTKSLAQQVTSDKILPTGILGFTIDPLIIWILAKRFS